MAHEPAAREAEVGKWRKVYQDTAECIGRTLKQLETYMRFR